MYHESIVCWNFLENFYFGYEIQIVAVEDTVSLLTSFEAQGAKYSGMSIHISFFKKKKSIKRTVGRKIFEMFMFHDIGEAYLKCENSK